MCLYWKKLHTCKHLSDRPYIEMCRPGFLSNTVCPDIREDPQARPSHFPCYPCIKAEARAELEAQAHAEHDAIAKTLEARERAVKEKQAAELRAKEERVRREAREKAAREREEEQRLKRQKEEEERKAKKEGGTWIETSGKKSKGRKSGGGAPMLPLGAPPGMKAVVTAKDKKENAGGEKMSPKKSPRKERGADPGGRAGFWGPKKILSRKEIGGPMGGNSGAK